jgi:tape measure domain-containing protein
MASKIVSLILQAKNMLSPSVDKAAESLKGLEGKARGLEKELAKFEGAQAAVKSLGDVKDAAMGAEKAFDEAQLEVIRLKAELKTTKTPELSLALDKAKISASDAKKEWKATQKTVGQLEATLKRAGVEVDDMSGAEKYLAGQVDKADKELKEHNVTLEKARGKLKSTGDAAKKSGVGLKSFIASAAGLIGVTYVVGKIRDGFTSLATAVFKTGDEFELLSKRLNSSELKFIEQFARDTPLQLQGVSEAFIRLRAFGVDPMNGSLQALVDQNAALGGGQAELEGIINAVGQAWAKQKLQQEEILQLVERGVPAWDLLSKATGKTTAELADLSSKGALGRKEIRLLMAEIAKANDGEAAKSMSTLSGMASNLTDDFTMFYRKVADYGALDKLKEALVGVREQIGAMADDGRLDKLASATSNYFSTVIQWGNDAASTLNTNFGAITGVAKIVANSIAIVFDGLKASVAGAAVVVASTLENMASFAGFDDFAKKAGIAAEAFKNQFEVASASVTENWQDIKDGVDLLPKSFDQVTNAINKTKDANKEQGDAAKKAGEASAKAGKDTESASRNAAEAANRHAEAQQEVAAALKRLGIDQSQLSNGISAGVEQSVKDLEVLQQRLSEIGSVSVPGEAVFDSLSSAISGIRTEADELALSDSIDSFRDKGQLTFDQYNALKDKIKDAGDTSEQSGDQMADGVEQVGKSAEQAGEKVQKVADDAKDTERDVRAVAAGLAAFFNGVKSDVYALSDAAGAAFSNKLGIDVTPVLEEIDSLKEGIRSAQVEMGTLARDNMKVFDVTGINRFENAVLATQNEVEIAYSSQKIKFLEYLDAIESGKGVNESFLNSAENSISNMKLLGQEDLSQLRNALDSANQKLLQMNDSAQSTLEGLQNELDSLQGNQDAIEQRDYNRKREELNAAIEDAKLYGNNEAVAMYTESLRVLDQVRREKSSQARENEREAKSASRSSSSSSSSASSSSTTINLRSPEGNKSVTLNGDQQAVDGLLDLLSDYGLRSQ